jgi:hypothetical protein
LRWLDVVLKSRVWWDIFVRKWRYIIARVPVGPRAWKGRCRGSSEHDAGAKEREGKAKKRRGKTTGAFGINDERVCHCSIEGSRIPSLEITMYL